MIGFLLCRSTYLLIYSNKKNFFGGRVSLNEFSTIPQFMMVQFLATNLLIIREKLHYLKSISGIDMTEVLKTFRVFPRHQNADFVLTK